jgi:hypothetical protein
LAKLGAASGCLMRHCDVGFAPFTLAFAGKKDATATPMTACFSEAPQFHAVHGPDQQHLPGPDEPVTATETE